MSNKSKDADPKQPDSSFIQFDDAKQQGAASAASASRRKALLGVLAAACTILIVVSLGFVHPSESGAWSIDWIVQTVTGGERRRQGHQGVWLDYDYDFGRGQFQGFRVFKQGIGQKLG